MTTKTPDVIRIDAEELGSIIEELGPLADAITGFGELVEARIKVRIDDHEFMLVHDGRVWLIEVPVP